MTIAVSTAAPLLDATKRFPTVLWNDSADPQELARSIEFGAVGATCNPVIALAAINADLPTWTSHISDLGRSYPAASESEIGWKVVEELSVRAARLLEPEFHRSGGRNGRLSMQTDPRLHRNAEALVEQAVHFSGLAPNIIVKIPATSTGLQAIEEATFRGVSINVTVSFSVAQAVASAEAIERGIAHRREAGMDEHEFGSVVTIMVGRLDDWLKSWVQKHRILVNPGHLEWAGVAAFKNAYRVFRERGFSSRLLSAAFRNHLHWSELQGGDLVVSPPFDWQARINENGIYAEDRILEPVDPDVLSTLLRVPEFVRAYEMDGMRVKEFDTFGPTVRTLRQFFEADEQLDRVVRDVLLPQP